MNVPRCVRAWRMCNDAVTTTQPLCVPYERRGRRLNSSRQFRTENHIYHIGAPALYETRWTRPLQLWRPREPGVFRLLLFDVVCVEPVLAAWRSG